MKKQLIIIRGLPGSGAYNLGVAIYDGIENSAFYSIDDVFERIGFNPKLLGVVHDRIYSDAIIGLIEADPSTVVVHSTFSTAREVSRYTDGIARIGLDVDVKIIKAPGSSFVPTDVPAYVIKRLDQRWEDIEGETVWDGQL